MLPIMRTPPVEATLAIERERPVDRAIRTIVLDRG